MQANPEGKRQSPFTVVRAMRRRKFYLLVPIVLLTSAVAVYTKRLPERFRARVLIASEASAPSPYLSGRNEAGPALNVQEHLRTIRETLLSPPVLETVIREFDLYDVGDREQLDRAIEAMKSRIQIQVEGPDAFYVGFDGDRPGTVAPVANRLAALFVERTTVIHGERVAQVDSVLDAEVNRLRNQLKAEEEGLKAYKQSRAQELPDRLSANLKLMENLQQEAQIKSDKIAQAQADRVAIVNEMLSLENNGALEQAPREKTDNEKRLDDLRLKLSQTKTRYTSANPEIQRLEKEIHDLEALGTSVGARRDPSPLHMRYVQLQARLPAIDQEVKTLQEERTRLTSQMSVYERRIDSSPGLETTLAERMRDATLIRNQYEAMLAKQQTAKLDQRVEKNYKQAAFKIIEPAQEPVAPYSPQRKQLVLFAFVASLGLGLAGVFLAEHLDSSFQTIEEVQEFTTLPILSSVPGIGPGGKVNSSRNGHHSNGTLRLRDDGVAPEQRRHLQRHRLTVMTDPQSIASQQYGILTLKLQRWKEQTGGKVIVVTSAAGGEGKSLTALNMSMAMASAMDGRVLLVDCDLRRPQVHERLGLDGLAGFSDLLRSTDNDVTPYVSKIGNLDVITGGTFTSDSAGNLSIRRTREVLARLRERYDFIVLDSPPIVPIADSHFLAGLADGVVLIIRARQTRRELLRRAVESLGATNILGVVLNDVEYADTRYAYAYRYYQRHYTSRH